MRIIIIGDGKVGHSLAERLIFEGHEITIVDRSESVLQRSMNTLDAMTVKGNGVNAGTLTEAGAQTADIVIAVTISDEINMLACLTAKRLGAKYAIARIRDPEYHKSLSFLMRELLIDYVINPERIMAQEISRILRYPFTGSIETFARGRVELMDFRVGREDGLAGIALKDLYAKKPRLPRVLFCAVQRGHEAIIPKGEFVFDIGDLVFVASDILTMTAFFKAIGKNTSGVRNVMIVGASRIAHYLTQLLLDMGMEVSVVELDAERASEFAELLPKANVILGDGTDQELLLSEGLSNYDAFVTLSGLDEENIMAGLYAKHIGVKKVIVKSSRDTYSELLGTLGLDSVISTKQVTSNTILRTVRARTAASAAAVEHLYRLLEGKVEALEFIIHAGEPLIDKQLKNLPLKPDALIAVIVRNGQVLIPTGSDALREGDRVIALIKDSGIETLNDLLV